MGPDGTLWRALDQTLARPVSVRVLRPGHPFAADVIDAARRAALVEDARLVRVVDVGTDGDMAFVVTELLEGETLAKLLERAPLPPPVVRRIVGEAAQGLARADNRGLHHLRLTPRSVLVRPDGAVKVVGVAVEAAAAGLEPHHAGTARRTDAVALVALVYAGLTGRWPLVDPGFPPAPRSPYGPVPPADLVRDVPNDLDTLCAVTLGMHDDGPQSPEELATQLAPWPSAAEAPAPRPAPSGAGPADTLRGPPRDGRHASHTPARTAGTAADGLDVRRAAVGPGGPRGLQGGEGVQAPLRGFDHRAETPGRGVGVPSSPAAPISPATVIQTTTSARPEPGTGQPGPPTAPWPASGPPAAVPPSPPAAERPAVGVRDTHAGDQGLPDAGPIGVTSTGESLLPWTEGAPAAPAGSAEVHGPFPLMIPPQSPPRSQSRLVIAVIATLVVVGLAVAVHSLSDLGRVVPLGAQAAAGPVVTAPATTRASIPPSTAAAPRTPAAAVPPQIASVRAVDPQGDGNEDGRDAPKVADGNDRTSWHSDTYNSAAYGNLKRGVGLVLTLRRPAIVHSVTLRVAGGGGKVEVHAGAAPSSAVIGSGRAGGVVTVNVRSSRPVRTVLLWFTRLPRDGGKYRLQVAEVAVR